MHWLPLFGQAGKGEDIHRCNQGHTPEIKKNDFFGVHVLGMPLRKINTIFDNILGCFKGTESH